MMQKRQSKVGAFWLRTKIVPFLAILTILIGAAATLATRAPAMASGSYNNADIATDALTHVGEKYGECWPFVRDMIYQASNHTQDITAAAGGNDYFLHLQNAGGTRIMDINALSKGDVVQKGEYGGHTFIIVSKVSVSGSTATYNVVDSNHAYNDVVMNYNRTFSLSNDERAYRFGTVNGSSGSTGTQTSTPASISFNGALNVFKIGGDGQVYQNYWNGTSWNGWSSLGGSTAVNNLAVIVNGSALNIFQLNANGQVYTEYNSGNGWSGWASLGGHQMVGSPKVIMYGSSQMDVFALDTNKVPYVDKWTPSGWSGWTSMGNYMASGASPAAIMYGSSEMDLFYRGGDNNIYKNTTFDGSSWGGFGSLGAPSGTTITGNPSVLSYTAEGEYDIYVNTTSNHIYKRTWNGAGWSSWTDMGGSFVGNPYAIQYGSDMNLFARGTDNRIYHRYWSYSGQFWSGWGSLGGNLASDPFALQYGSSELDVFATGTDGKTDHDTFTPTNGWGGFSAL